MKRRTTMAIVVAILLSSMSIINVGAVPIVQPTFERTWARTDQPVANSSATRTWMWGPSPFTATMWEPYEDAPGGRRLVQYFDKSRMEITNPNNDQNSIWYVTNGLIAKELITGQVQLGDNAFETRVPAAVTVAGDPDDAAGPTYASFTALLAAPAASGGTVLTNRVDRNGAVTPDPALSGRNVTAAQLVSETGHTIAKPFWDFMNASGPVYQNNTITTAPLFENPYFATGFPITEAYWASVQVGGQARDVLMQCFERRCLTYTPDNPIEWQVEMGNVGQHYFKWRHAMDIPAEPPALPTGDYQAVNPAPYAQQFDNDGQAWLRIANQSPFVVTVTFAGAAPYSLTLPACPTCQVYPSVAAAPECTAETPQQEFFLPPGNYSVVFDFASPTTRSGIAHWTLIPDADYSGCYVVISD